MKKSYAILIALLLVLPMLTVAVPVRASSGTVDLGVASGTTTSDTVALALYNVSVAAGSAYGTNDVTGASGLFCIIFNNVTFSGTQFNLYLSQNGFASITSNDLLYAATFNVNDLEQPLHQVNITMGASSIMSADPTTYWIGTLNGFTVIIGPIPLYITSSYEYIKVFDGSSGAVAASIQTISVLPALTLVPTSGPGGETVTLTGIALAANTTYNITYYDDTTHAPAAQVTTDSNGRFSFTWNIEDLCTDWNYISGPSVNVPIYIWNDATQSLVQTVIYAENARTLLSATSSAGGNQMTSAGAPWTDGVVYTWGGNASYYENYGYNALLDVQVLSTMHVVGNWFNPSAPVNVIIGGQTVATFTTNGTGFFNETVNIPVLAQGLHNVTLANGGCNLIFTINVIPTLIVTPDVGPIGTNVTFTAYGFPVGPVSLYWYSDYACNYDNEWTWIANATVGTDGQFNVTVPWTIPSTPGGYLEIDAYQTFLSNYSATDWIADTYFLVTPSMVVTPNSLPANGSVFTVVATGLIPNTPYTIDIDNQAFALPNYFSYTYGYGSLSTDTGTVQFADSVAWSDSCGNVAIQLVAAGFRPGEHVVALYTSSSDAYAFGGPFDGGFYTYGFGNYSLNQYVLFTVTTEGDAVINATLTEINSTYLSTIGAQITSIQNDVATIQTNTGTIQAAVSALDAKVTSLQGNVATISTNLGTLTGTVTSIQGDVATIKTDVGTIKATTTSIKSFLPVDLTPVWIAVILSLIAAIASIYCIIVIRSKIAA